MAEQESKNQFVFCESCGVRVNDEHTPCDCARRTKSNAEGWEDWVDVCTEAEKRRSKTRTRKRGTDVILQSSQAIDIYIGAASKSKRPAKRPSDHQVNQLTTSEMMAKRAEAQRNMDNCSFALAQRFEEARPQGTKQAYTCKQDEYKSFCEEEYPGEYSSTVTEQKLVYFMSKAVLGRKHRKRGRKKPKHGSESESSSSDDEQSKKEIGLSTVKQYVSAIVDLYAQQKLAGVNSHPHPRGEQVKRLLHTLSRERNAHRKRTYVDRGIGTLQDGYKNTDELVSIGNQLMKQSEGTWKH